MKIRTSRLILKGTVQGKLGKLKSEARKPGLILWLHHFLAMLQANDLSAGALVSSSVKWGCFEKCLS